MERQVLCAENGSTAHAVPEVLDDFFRSHPRVLLAFSGGTDSSYLLYAAKECGADVVAYTAEGPFQPAFETHDAKVLAGSMDMEHRIIEVDPLSDPGIVANGPDRCYLCKRMLFGTLRRLSDEMGRELIDATNASDDPSGRPGMRALEELGVISPLRLCGITKAMVRELSAKAGLPTAHIPSNSCLATRVRTGTPITADALKRVEESEDALRAMGLSGFRVRDRGESCILEVTDADKKRLDGIREDVEASLRKHYSVVTYGTRRQE